VERVGERVIAAGVELAAGEYEVRLAAAHPDSTAALPGNTGLVELDTAVTPELAAEGTARDVVRVVQQARRESGLAVSDRIRLTVGADGDVADAVRAHSAFIALETLAVELTVQPLAEVDAPARPVGDGGPVRVVVEVADRPAD
jgi:isoleucyl-tRNA synthetase